MARAGRGRATSARSTGCARRRPRRRGARGRRRRLHPVRQRAHIHLHRPADRARLAGPRAAVEPRRRQPHRGRPDALHHSGPGGRAALLARYKVDYAVVGPLERTTYGDPGAAALGREVFEDEGTRVLVFDRPFPRCGAAAADEGDGEHGARGTSPAVGDEQVEGERPALISCRGSCPARPGRPSWWIQMGQVVGRALDTHSARPTGAGCGGRGPRPEVRGDRDQRRRVVVVTAGVVDGCHSDENAIAISIGRLREPDQRKGQQRDREAEAHVEVLLQRRVYSSISIASETCWSQLGTKNFACSRPIVRTRRMYAAAAQILVHARVTEFMNGTEISATSATISIDFLPAPARDQHGTRLREHGS